ncbi:hypothetical protein BJF78_32490 [Pseudonocardia sp. CNS-139]|nr:hypothetical protein BJF78_32490 [Pseudonocardia sp. CNS-139]
MPRDPRTYLWDAARAADLIASFVGGRTFEEYGTDDMLRSAVERQFEIIGESLNQLSRVDAALAGRVPDLARLVAFRNILIHGYAIVDDALVWDAATVKLPGLRKVLAALLDG